MVLAAVLTVMALGCAVQQGNGMIGGSSFFWLNLGVAACLAGMLLPAWSMSEKLAERLLGPIILAGLICDFALWQIRPPGKYLELQTADQVATFHDSLAAAAVLSGLGLATPSWLRKLHVPLLLLVFAVMGAWQIRHAPHPKIDVVQCHNESLDALVHGTNPFAITYQDLYNEPDHYGPGGVKDGRVQAGYGYMPLDLLLSIPGYAFGDYRYALLAALLVAAAFMAYTVPGWLASCAVALFLFMPRTLFMLENGWIEPYGLMFLAAAVYAAVHRRDLLFIPLGLLLACKQTMVVPLTAAFLLPDLRSQPRQVLTLIAKGLGVALIPTLPFVLWSPEAFWHSTLGAHLNVPFQPEALNYLAWWKLESGETLPLTLGFATGLGALALALWRAPKNAFGFCYGFAFIFLFFIAFTRQAFCNYYYLIMGALLMGVAISRGLRSPQPG